MFRIAQCLFRISAVQKSHGIAVIPDAGTLGVFLGVLHPRLPAVVITVFSHIVAGETVVEREFQIPAGLLF